MGTGAQAAEMALELAASNTNRFSGQRNGISPVHFLDHDVQGSLDAM
ncbi:MAG TPA: hypothetical protein VFU16_12790 [Solirubrobacterales bacterium]|nr:hypothetical protein [Solirubrobacterales bacterium]